MDASAVIDTLKALTVMPGKYVKRGIIYVIVMIMIPLSGFSKDYIIGGGDTLTISVWGSPDLSIENTTVRPDGKVSIPALGEIKADGYTALELKNILEKEMTRIVKAPIVTVIVTNMTNYKVFVFGRGGSAGEYPLQRETTLLEFLSRLGSLENADLQRAYMVRNKKIIKKGFSDLYEKGDLSKDIELERDDKLFIPDNFDKRISVVGEVTTPTTIPYREGLTIMDVILSAGGFTEFADRNGVEIHRNKENNETTKISVRGKDLMKGDLERNIKMLPGDVVVVKESLF